MNNPFSGWDVRNILTGPNLTILLLFVGLLALVGLLSVSFRGAVVV